MQARFPRSAAAAAAHRRHLVACFLPEAVPAPAASQLYQSPTLLAQLESASASFLEPEAFFVSWQGVLTLAYRGFTPPLVDLKQRISAAHPGLPPENPGSKWPKTSLGCLRDQQRLTPAQLAELRRICEEESAALRQQRAHQQAGAGSGNGSGSAAAAAAATAAAVASSGAARGIKLTVNMAAIVIFECRSLERVLSYQPVTFTGGLDAAPPADAELARVASILAEQDAPDYWLMASRDGNREGHYRGSHLGATLMHPLLLLPGEHTHASAAASEHRRGINGRGMREEAQHRQALLEAVARFRARVDAALPGMYAWFSNDSLHVTLRALIN